MLFDYVATRNFAQTLTVEHVGDCCIRAKNNEGDLFYLRIKSIMGKAYLIRALQVNPDISSLLEDFTVSFKSIKYNEKVLMKEISLFLNNSDCGIVEAEECEEEDMFNDLPNIKEKYDNC